MRDLTNEEHHHLSAIALQVARKTRRQYSMVDIDDLIQEALMWGVTHPRKLREYLDDEDNNRGTRMLVAAMRNHVKGYARSERAEQYGYELEDEMFYSLAVLKGVGRGKGLLHYVYDRESWLKPPPGDGGPRSPGDPAEGGGWLATLVDVDRAVKTLPKADERLLAAHFDSGYTYEQIGSSFPVPVAVSTVSKRIDAACVKVQDALGGARPREDPPEPDYWEGGYVGTRRAISNAHARAITDNQEHATQYVGSR